MWIMLKKLVYFIITVITVRKSIICNALSNEEKDIKRKDIPNDEKNAFTEYEKFLFQNLFPYPPPIPVIPALILNTPPKDQPFVLYILPKAESSNVQVNNDNSFPNMHMCNPMSNHNPMNGPFGQPIQTPYLYQNPTMISGMPSDNFIQPHYMPYTAINPFFMMGHNKQPNPYFPNQYLPVPYSFLQPPPFPYNIPQPINPSPPNIGFLQREKQKSSPDVEIIKAEVQELPSPPDSSTRHYISTDIKGKQSEEVYKVDEDILSYKTDKDSGQNKNKDVNNDITYTVNKITPTQYFQSNRKPIIFEDRIERRTKNTAEDIRKPVRSIRKYDYSKINL